MLYTISFLTQFWLFATPLAYPRGRMPHGSSAQFQAPEWHQGAIEASCDPIHQVTSILRSGAEHLLRVETAAPAVHNP